MGVTVLVFAAALQNCAPHAFSPIIERGLRRVSKWHVCGRGKKAQNNRFFFQNLDRDITVRTQGDKDGA